MKKIILLTIISLSPVFAFAQQRSYGQWGGHLSTGWSAPNSWAINVGFEKNFKLSKSFLSGDFIFFDEKYKIRNHDGIVHSSNAEFAIQYNYGAYQWKNLNIAVGGGLALGGIFYRCKESEITLPLKNDISAGIIINSNIEYCVTNKISVYMQPLYMYDFAMNTKKLEIKNGSRSKFLLLVGCKYFF